MAIHRLGAHAPDIAPSAYVAPTATVVGKVALGDRCSVWFGAVVRGDNDPITLGAGSNVQDNAVLHADPGFPLVVGERVTIGHQVMLHGCTIGDGSLVGIQAIVMNGAVIGRQCLVGAGAIVTEGKIFPDRSLILGAPAKVVRALTEEDVARLDRAADEYVRKGALYREQLDAAG